MSLSPDLALLPATALEPRNLTAHIASRFHQGMPFCTISTGTLIAVNNFSGTDELDGNQEQVFKDLAARIQHRMAARQESQVVVFMGEVGTGKSTFANCLESQLLTLAGNPLSAKIRAVTPVLEAFSTAKTTTSSRSSKCGFIHELQYDAEGTLIGAAAFDYRLERSRVTHVITNERNFEVFYYMLNGLSDAERYHLQLGGLDRYRYLGHPSQLHQPGSDDRLKFKQLKLALYQLGFSRADVANIFQVLAAILHLGQVQFKASNMDSSVAATAAVEISNPDIVEIVASFLGVIPDVLSTSLISKTVYVGRDRVTVLLDQRGAKENAAVLARTLYTMIFTYIMNRINESLSLSADGDNSLIASTISLVDFPGFSIGGGGTPSLDRLLHNTANEMLYNYLVHVYFRSHEDELDAEEVVVPETTYFDNKDTLKSLVQPSRGLLSVINSYAQRDKDEAHLQETLRSRFHKSENITPEQNAFIVRHYGGEVEYSTKGLLDDAKESISGDVINMMGRVTSSDFLRDVFKTSAVVDDTFGSDNIVVAAHLSSEPRRQMSIRAPERAGTVRRTGSIRKPQRPQEATEERGRVRPNRKNKNPSEDGACSNFVASLDRALDAFESAHSYFVLCLKPNDSRMVSQLDARCVRQQVTALGIPDLATRSQISDLSLFMPFAEYMRYHNATLGADDDGHDHTGPSTNERDRVMTLVAAQGWPERDVRIGTTGLFMSENAWIQLVDPHLTFIDEAARKFANAGPDMGFGQGQDLETKSLAGGFGNMFSYTAPSNDKNKYGGDMLVGGADIDAMEDATDLTAPPRESSERRTWLALVTFYTWWIPSLLLKKLGHMQLKNIRLAWREKLTINMIIWGMCAGTALLLIGMPYLVCPLQNVISEGDLNGYTAKANSNKVYTSIRGMVFDITHFSYSHYPPIVPSDELLNYGGKESGDLFPIPISSVCEGVNGSISDWVIIGNPNNYSDPNAQYHDFRYFTGDFRPDWYLQQMDFLQRNYHKSFIGYTPKAVQNIADQKSRAVVMLDGYVYDMTDYITNNIYLKAPPGETVDSNTDLQFLAPELVSLIQGNLGQDISHKWKQADVDDLTRQRMNRCMRNIFMIGAVDSQNSRKCLFARYFLLAITIAVCMILISKFLAALQFGGYEYPDDLDKFVLCQVPAYTEDETSLRRAIDSLARTKYDDKRKLLVVICDGMIRGVDSDIPTPRIVLNILGFPEHIDPPPLAFESLGEGDKQLNYGKVYSGLYEVGGHIVPYLVIVKVGKPTESTKPGNRGKRDSQMILMRFLNRVHYNLPMSPLELEIYDQMQNKIGINPMYYEYLMQVDADTVVSQESLAQLAGKLVKDNRIQAVCGETELSNSRHSLVTMIQVYEYYISHNLAKAFESLFGTVTCLPGCFTLYRIWEHETGLPLLVSHPVVEKYSENNVRTLHMKNLLHLGEDRYLTTLLLKFNPRFSTKFLRHARAWTIAPDTWSVFMSQRRRWINSTVHNMVELVPMDQMCGFCCFSMRFMVLIDLFSTLVQPVALAYIAYLIYLCVSRPDMIPYSSIALIGAVYGLQIVVFLLRLKWEMIGWMFVYLLAMPVFSLMLPLYAFWYMDDFSWGNTRVVFGEKGEKMLVNDEGHYDPSEMVLRTWKEAEPVFAERLKHHHSEFESRRSSLGPADTISLAPSGILGAPSTYTDHPSPAQQSPKSEPSDQDLTEAIRELLASGDLSQMTKRSIRTQLESQFGIQLANRREYISWATEALLSGEL